ncbi:MAG: hypothetical protein AB8G11_09630 [Saprospiraceae bacterium]
MNNKANLQELIQLSINAFRNTSFDPEKRGEQYIRENEKALIDDLKEIENATEEEKERYINGFKKHYSNWMSAKSRCFSVMITGAGGFNNRRHEKANNSERNRSDDFYNFRNKAIAGILKAIKKRRPQSEINSENWVKCEEMILESCAYITNIDTGINKGSSRTLIQNGLYNRVLTFAKNGEIEIIKKATQLVKNYNEQVNKPIFTNRHKFWKLEEETEKIIKANEERQGKEDKIHNYNGFKIVISYKDERIKIVHDEKPERKIIDIIKNYGFRWAFKEKVWQRKLTNNGIYNTKLLLKELNPIEKN